MKEKNKQRNKQTMKSSSSEEPGSEQKSPIPVFLRSSNKEIPGFWLSKEIRNWVELPSDVMSLIFTFVGTIDILGRVQYVCSTWRNLCKQPHLFRSIDIYGNDVFGEDDYSAEEHDMLEELAMEAVRRSRGNLVELSIKYFATDILLKRIISKQYPLRRLRFVSCHGISVSAVKHMAKEHPLLEELEICYCDFGSRKKMIVNFGRACPLLESFTFKNIYRRKACDKEALAIAQSMPGLSQLNLTGANLTDNGLRAILDGCLHLNFLDLNECLHLNFAGGLVQMFVDRNIEVRASNVVSYRLINEMERHFSSLMLLQYKFPHSEGLFQFQLQYEIPHSERLFQLQYEILEYKHHHTGYETYYAKLDDIYSLHIKVLHRTLTQMQSQLWTRTQMVLHLEKIHELRLKAASILESILADGASAD